MKLSRALAVLTLVFGTTVYAAPGDFDRHSFDRDVRTMNKSLAKAKTEKSPQKSKLMEEHMGLMMNHMNMMMKMMHGSGGKGHMMNGKAGSGHMHEKGMMMNQEMMGEMMQNMMSQMKAHHDVCMTAINDSK